MTLHDFHCSFSDLSLTHRETGFILLSTSQTGSLVPAGLPIWGRYNGLGGFDDIQDGPNADLILAQFQKELQAGRLKIDFEALGLPEYALESLDLLISLFFCAQLHHPEAISFHGKTLRFALVSAHLAAQLMESEIQDEAPELSLEELPQTVFKESLFGQGIYTPLREQGLKLRCRFGLSMIALQALQQGLKIRQLELQPPQSAIEFKESEQSANLLNALNRFAEDHELLDALREYLGDESIDS